MVDRLLITGGGTAGHIHPAAAIIEYLKKYHPETRILFIGTRKGMENKLIPELGIDFKTVNASGFSATENVFKKFLVYIKFILNLISGFFTSIYIIGNFKPHFILGMGGYVCGPVFLASVFLRKEIGLHEQNYIPGRLNKFFTKFSKYIFLSFEDSKKYFIPEVKNDTAKLIFSGDPVRQSIRDFKFLKPQYNKWQLEENRFTVVAFGGSLGAEKINNSVLGLYDDFRNDSRIQFMLISGERFYEELNKILLNIKKPGDKLIFKLFSYIKEMDHIYRIADLIISRAGATTIAELIVTNIPAILIPYPRAIENHQFYNAEFLVKNGKALLVTDESMCAEVLLNQIQNLLANGCKKYFRMKEKELEVRNINAAQVISDKILNIT